MVIDLIPEAKNERRSESEEKVLSLLKNKLNLDPHTIRIERVPHVGKMSKTRDRIHGSP